LIKNFSYFKKQNQMEDQASQKTKPWVSALGLTFQLGYTIAIPLVVLALFGRFLDKKFDTSPWLLLTGIILSLLITSWLIYLKIAKIMNELSKCEKKIKEKK